MTEPAVVSMWTIYSPDQTRRSHRALRHVTMAGVTAETGDQLWGRLSMVRAFIARQGYTCIGRNDEDDPTILETWI